MTPEQWLERFEKIVSMPEEKINLAEAALVIAADEYPDLDVAQYLARLDELAKRVRSRFDTAASPRDKIAVLNDYLFTELGFKGNRDDYYDPRNSYLNDVLDRRLGIPITLSVIYIEIGRRLGFPLSGVAMPDHFILRWKTDDLVILIDPFDSGHVIGQFALPQPEGVRARLAWIQAVGSRRILARMLNNLRNIFVQSESPEKLLPVLEKILVSQPSAAEILREAAAVAYKLKAYRRAAGHMQGYVTRFSETQGAEQMRVRLNEIEEILLRLN